MYRWRTWKDKKYIVKDRVLSTISHWTQTSIIWNEHVFVILCISYNCWGWAQTLSRSCRRHWIKPYRSSHHGHPLSNRYFRYSLHNLIIYLSGSRSLTEWITDSTVKRCAWRSYWRLGFQVRYRYKRLDTRNSARERKSPEKKESVVPTYPDLPLCEKKQPYWRLKFLSIVYLVCYEKY